MAYPPAYAKATCVEKVGSRVYWERKRSLFTTIPTIMPHHPHQSGACRMSTSPTEIPADYNTLIITYRSGNIDLLRNGQFMQLDAIPRSTVPGLKTIFHVAPARTLCLPQRGLWHRGARPPTREIRNTFIIGPQGSRLPVNALTDDGTNFYAATDSGMYVASLSAPTYRTLTSGPENPCWVAAPQSLPYVGIKYIPSAPIRYCSTTAPVGRARW